MRTSNSMTFREIFTFQDFSMTAIFSRIFHDFHDRGNPDRSDLVPLLHNGHCFHRSYDSTLNNRNTEAPIPIQEWTLFIEMPRKNRKHLGIDWDGLRCIWLVSWSVSHWAFSYFEWGMYMYAQCTHRIHTKMSLSIHACILLLNTHGGVF